MIVFSGCEDFEEELKPDYIYVEDELYVQLCTRENNETYWIRDALVKGEIEKDGGERVSEIMKTGYGGVGEPTLKHSFKLYKGESFVCYANPILGSLNNFSDYTFSSDVHTYTWDVVSFQTEMGLTKNYYPQLTIIGVKNS